MAPVLLRQYASFQCYRYAAMVEQGYAHCGAGIEAPSAYPQLSLLFHRVLLSFLALQGCGPATWTPARRFLIELMTVVLPQLLVMTVIADYSAIVLAMLCVAIIVLHAAAVSAHGRPLLAVGAGPDHAVWNLMSERKLSFISNFRSGMMIATCIAILAVDFPAFPRRFAKTETFGLSVMDIGVGAFVMASALVSPEARSCSMVGDAKSDSQAASQSTAPAAPPSVLLHVTQKLLKVAPLLVFGGLRVLVHARVNYPTHPSEYGVHWNFFFTMAVVALLAVAVERLSPWCSSVLRRPALFALEKCFWRGWPSRWCCVERDDALAALGYMTAGLTVGACYQALLVTRFPAWALPGAVHASDLQSYILNADRDETSFISQNREGLAGVLGFFAIYLSGVAVGRLLNPARRTILQWRRFAWLSCALCALLWLFYFSSLETVGPVSRRLVNLPYVAWILAFTSSQIVALLGFELVTNVYGGSTKELNARDAVAVAAVHGETGVPATLPSASLTGDRALEGEREPNYPSDWDASEHSDDSGPHEGDTGSSPSRPRSSVPGHGASLEDDDDESGSGGTGAARPRFSAASRRASASRDHQRQLRAISALPGVSQAVIDGGSLLVEAFSFNLLAVFVVANLLVGVVNAAVETLDTPAAPALALLSLYMATICVAAVVLRLGQWRISLK